LILYFQTVNGFVMRVANHLALPFVSFEKQSAPAISVGNMSQPLFVPIMVSVEQSRVGAQCVMAKLAKHPGVEAKVLEASMLSKTTLPQAEAMILVLPEYNYGFPNELKTLVGKNPAVYHIF
jgi:hypothetical protein